MTLVIDFSHVHRPTTGIERVSLDLFSAEALPGIKTRHVRAKSTLGMIFAQWVKLPLLALFFKNDTFLCPGFPASIPLVFLGRNRVIPYIHDLFLIERKQDLNTTAKYYMRPSFWFAVHFCKTFLVNSSYTEQQLRKYCSKNAQIRLFRPEVADVFGLANVPAKKEDKNGPLCMVSIGTIEPRKNLRFAAEVRKELENILGRAVELHLAGRMGWSDDTKWLGQQKSVVLHGYCSSQKVRDLIQNADVFISTSKDEGLGLPLLEVQHGGLFVAASDIPVYREVLGKSGCLLPLGDAIKSAHILADVLSHPELETTRRQQTLDNVHTWNKRAKKDRDAFLLSFNEQENVMPNIVSLVSFCRKIIRQDPRLISLARKIMWNPTLRSWKHLISEMPCFPIKKTSDRFLIITPDPYSITGSLGDYAMIEALVAAARKQNDNIEIAIITGSNKADDAVRKLGLKPLQIWAAAALPYKIKEELVHYNPDIVVIMGADVMDGYYNSFFTFQQMVVADISARLGARTSVSGFSFNNKPARELKEVFESVHHSVIFNVRDPSSYANFSSFCSAPAQLVADAAFCLKPSSDSDAVKQMFGFCGNKKNEGWTILAVNIHPLLIKNMSRKQVTKIVDSISSAIKTASKQRNILWVLTPHDYRGTIGDAVILTPLYNVLKRMGVPEVYLLRGKNSAADMKALAEYFDGVIAARMHLAIACLGRGKPVLAITYQDKFKGLLQHFGLPEWLLMEPTLLLDTNAFEQKIVRFVDEIAGLKTKVEEKLPFVESLSSKNFEQMAVINF